MFHAIAKQVQISSPYDAEEETEQFKTSKLFNIAEV